MADNPPQSAPLASNADPLTIGVAAGGTLVVTAAIVIGLIALHWLFGERLSDVSWLWNFMHAGVGIVWVALVGTLWLRTNKAFVEWAAKAAAEMAAKEARTLEKARAVIVRKLPELRRARASCVGKWGDLDALRWEKERADFVDSVLRPTLTRSEFARLRLGRISSLIDETMAAPLAGDPAGMSGIDYEEFCAGLLRKAGWSVETTKASGDQGVDLIAVKGAWRVALQCKRYTGSVPNAAVQEVAAGSVYYAANAKAVVSTGSYTASARTLAEATRTLLMSHEQLPGLEAALEPAKVH